MLSKKKIKQNDKKPKPFKHQLHKMLKHTQVKG